MTEETKTRICFRLDEQQTKEWIWAARVGPDLYRLLHIPVLAYGYARGDTVYCVAYEGSVLEAVTLDTDSEHRTVRVLFAKVSPLVDYTIAYMEKVGCICEQYDARLLLLDVPPEDELKISVRELAEYLDGLERAELLRWEAAK